MRCKREQEEWNEIGFQMVGKLDVWANRTVLEEDMMIAEKIERPV